MDIYLNRRFEFGSCIVSYFFIANRLFFFKIMIIGKLFLKLLELLPKILTRKISILVVLKNKSINYLSLSFFQEVNLSTSGILIILIDFFCNCTYDDVLSMSKNHMFSGIITKILDTKDLYFICIENLGYNYTSLSFFYSWIYHVTDLNTIYL